MQVRNSRLQIAIASVAAGLGLVSSAGAATFNDAAAGNWEASTTWSETSAPTSTSDDIFIDQFTVTTSIAAFTGGNINVSGSGRLNFSGGWSSSATAFNLSLNGGTFFGGWGHNLSGASGISVSGTSTIIGPGAGDTNTMGSDSSPVVLTGSGTLVTQGTGQIVFNSDISAANASNFSGTVEIQEGIANFYHINMLKDAAVKLSDGKLQTSFGGVSLASQPVVRQLLGNGSVAFQTSGYARDLAIAAGGVISPGTSTTPGTISRSTKSASNTNISNNELVFRTDGTSGNSRLEMDIFGGTQADADLISWLDSVATSTVDFSNADLVVRMFTPTASLGQTSWTILEGDQFGIATNGAESSGAASAITFSSVQFIADAGWQNLAVSYDYTDGASKVIVSGQYVVVPEPATLGLIASAAMLLGGRRRRPA